MSTSKKIETEIEPGITVGFRVVESSVSDKCVIMQLQGVWAKGEFRIGVDSYVANLNFSPIADHEVRVAFPLVTNADKPEGTMSQEQLQTMFLGMADMIVAYKERIIASVDKKGF